MNGQSTCCWPAALVSAGSAIGPAWSASAAWLGEFLVYIPSESRGASRWTGSAGPVAEGYQAGVLSCCSSTQTENKAAPPCAANQDGRAWETSVPARESSPGSRESSAAVRSGNPLRSYLG